MDISKLIGGILHFLRSAWRVASANLGAFLRRHCFALIWSILALTGMIAAGRITYWYRAVYEPREYLRANPPATIEYILQSLNVTLGDFDLPSPTHSLLDDEYLFSQTPQQVWDEKALKEHWIPSEEMGLQKITQEADETMRRLVADLP